MKTDFQKAYRSKLISPAKAAGLIKSDTDISMGMALGEPSGLLKALAARLDAKALTDIRLWYFHSMPSAALSVLSYNLMDRVHPHCMFMGPIERALVKRGEADGRKVVNFVPVAFSDAPHMLSEHVPIETYMTVVSPMDKHGYFSFGTNNDYASTVARSAKHTLVEVNPNMPRVFGDSMIHISEVDAVIEHDAPLFEMVPRKSSKVDDIISRIIAERIPDGACLQMGIGALPNAVCSHLKDHKNLGIHTELLSPGLVELIECGAVTNRLKKTFPGQTVFTFALGNKRMFEIIDNNPSITSHPVHIVNDPRHIAKNDNVYSINSTLQVDLYGACNSENLEGRQYSGSGGQLDFVRGARASKGGRSIIACPSQAKDGTISRIVPRLSGPVTVPRNDVDTIVTEYGVAHLIGLSGEERAKALINIAHPDHREALTKAAKTLMMI